MNQTSFPHKQGNSLFLYLPVSSVLVKAQILFHSFLHDARLTGLIYPVISFAFFKHSGKTLTFL